MNPTSVPTILARDVVADHQLLTTVIETLADIAAVDLEPQAIMQAITERTCNFTRADGASLELVEGKELICQSVTGITAAHRGVRFPIAGSLSGRAVIENMALYCVDSETDERVDRIGCRVVGARALIAVPLPHNGRVVGTLKVLSKTPGAFTQSHIDALKLMAGLLGAALNHAIEFEAKKVLLAERTSALAALRESEERFRSAFEYAPIGKAIVGLDGRWLQVNRTMCEIVGYTEAEMLKTDFQHITHPEDLGADLEFVRKLVAGEIRTYQMHKRYFHKDGHIVWVHLAVSLVKDEQQMPLYFISQVQDVTERKRMERLESDHRRILEMIAQDRPLKQIITALIAIAEDHIPGARACFLLVHGGEVTAIAPHLPEAALLSMRARPVTIAAAMCGNLNSARQSASHDLSAGSLPPDFSREMTANGLGHCWAIPIDDGDGSPLGVWSVFARQTFVPDEFTSGLCDTITHLANLSIRRQENADSLARRAHHDPLTGLPNRSLFADRLDQAIANATRNGSACGLLILDIDHFKSINDTQGHDAGDRLLHLFARRIRVLLRESDTMARLGGDEFALVLPNLSSPDDAVTVARKIMESLKESFRLPTQNLVVTSSIGICLCPTHALDAQSMQKAADVALYQVKRRGRNGYELAAPIDAPPKKDAAA
jgi:diguanylate cyclase (GGDEF)-like protein/PAS domain S-box-containing protein